MDNIYPKIDGYKARDYGSRDSGLSLFFLPAVRRVPENRIPGVWHHMGTLVPYERRVRPARYSDVRARSPRGPVELWRSRRRRAAGWLVLSRLMPFAPFVDRAVFTGLVLSTLPSQPGFPPPAS